LSDRFSVQGIPSYGTVPRCGTPPGIPGEHAMTDEYAEIDLAGLSDDELARLQEDGIL
jgi:hypothetical protein